MNEKEELIEWYENAFGRYGEATVSDYWQDKYGDDSWEEFHSLDGKLKVKFYYEDSE